MRGRKEREGGSRGRRKNRKKAKEKTPPPEGYSTLIGNTHSAKGLFYEDSVHTSVCLRSSAVSTTPQDMVEGHSHWHMLPPGVVCPCSV